MNHAANVSPDLGHLWSLETNWCAILLKNMQGRDSRCPRLLGIFAQCLPLLRNQRPLLVKGSEEPKKPPSTYETNSPSRTLFPARTASNGGGRVAHRKAFATVSRQVEPKAISEWSYIRDWL
jgi:hypothetical protein